MSEPDNDVTVDVDGVSIRKTLNDHQFETLAVVFDIRSGGEHAVDVTVTESIPDGVAVDDIGFHPEYGGEHWRAEEGSVIFSRTFEPGEQYTTVYGVRDLEDERDALLSEPSLQVGHQAVGGGIQGIDDLVSEEDSDAVREVISGERDTLPGLEDESADGAEEPAEIDATGADEGPDEAEAGAGSSSEKVDADATTGTDDSTPTAAAESGGEQDVTEPVGGPALADDDGVEGPALADDEGVGDSALPDEGEEEPVVASEAEEAAPAAGSDDEDDEVAAEEVAAEETAVPAAEPSDEIRVPVTGGIARVLAKELRAGNVSHEDRRLLREELLPEGGSTDARIQRIQTQVADLVAYTDALERFLDEEGGAKAVMEDVEGQVEGLAEDLRDVESAFSDLEVDVEAVEEDVSEVAEDVEEVEDDVDGVSADVGEVSGTVERLERDVESIRDDLDRVEGLDRRLESFEDDVSAIHAELEDLAAFRDRLSSVFGAAGGPAGAGSAPEDSEDGDDEGSGGY